MYFSICLEEISKKNYSGGQAINTALETLLDKHISLPVGRVQYPALHPCSFTEFLDATGNERFVELLLNAALPPAFHDELMKKFNTYSLTGGEAFRTLNKAMLLEPVYPITSAVMPAASDLKKSPKLFWLDAGIVNYVAKIQKEYILSADLLDTWRGKAAEQIAYQELKALSFDVGEKLNFWVRAKRGSAAEVDFVYRFDGKIIPIEVKSGHNARLKSLHRFMDESEHDTAVRVWTGKYSIDEVKTPSHKTFRLINLPFYMISALPEILRRMI